MVPNRAPTSHTASAHVPDQRDHLLGACVGGEIEVLHTSAHDGIAHRAPDQVQLVSGGCELLPQVVEHGPVAAQLLQGRVTCGVQNLHLRRGPGHLPQASPP